MKATDAEILSAYERLGSVWKTADELGMCGQSVHERLVRMGANKPVNVFTDAEKEILMREYIPYKDAGKLDTLAAKMGRTKQFICRKAGELGLTDRNTARQYLRVWDTIDDEVLYDLMHKYSRSQGTISEFCTRHGYGSVGFERECAKRFPAEWEAIVELKRSKQPMYKVGRSFEYATKKDLEKYGYIVMRSPASKTPADLVAIRAGEIVFVQCKLHGAMGVKEWNEFIDYSEKGGATPVMAQRSQTGRGITYSLLTAKKDGSRKRQPMTEWKPR